MSFAALDIVIVARSPLSESPSMESLRKDLVLSKLRWAAETHSEKQIQDAFGVLAVQRGALDEEYMRRFARELGVDGTLEKLLHDSRPPE